MATNVTEKDKTLQEVIDWCEQLEIEGLKLANALLSQRDMADKSTHTKRQPTTAVPCSAIPAPCRPRCRIKARTRNEQTIQGLPDILGWSPPKALLGQSGDAQKAAGRGLAGYARGLPPDRYQVWHQRHHTHVHS